MELFETINNRHSYRGEYLYGTIPHTALKRIAEAAMAAPSGRNRQTTGIVIVTNPDKITEIAKILEKPAIANAGAHIIFFFDPSETYGVEDCAAACENALLAITALGYASCWLDGALRREGRTESIGGIVSLPPQCKARVLLPVGRPAGGITASDKKNVAERVFLDKYGGLF